MVTCELMPFIPFIFHSNYGVKTFPQTNKGWKAFVKHCIIMYLKYYNKITTIKCSCQNILIEDNIKKWSKSGTPLGLSTFEFNHYLGNSYLIRCCVSHILFQNLESVWLKKETEIVVFIPQRTSTTRRRWYGCHPRVHFA